VFEVAALLDGSGRARAPRAVLPTVSGRSQQVRPPIVDFQHRGGREKIGRDALPTCPATAPERPAAGITPGCPVCSTPRPARAPPGCSGRRNASA